MESNNSRLENHHPYYLVHVWSDVRSMHLNKRRRPAILRFVRRRIYRSMSLAEGRCKPRFVLLLADPWRWSAVDVMVEILANNYCWSLWWWFRSTRLLLVVAWRWVLWRWKHHYERESPRVESISFGDARTHVWTLWTKIWVNLCHYCSSNLDLMSSFSNRYVWHPQQ